MEKYPTLESIPEEERRYKCSAVGCKKIIKSEDILPDGACPNCGQKEYLNQMCPVDTASCNDISTSGVATCPLCGELVCPECGGHDISITSRVTGYMGEVSGWNRGKISEFTDRVRHIIT